MIINRRLQSSMPQAYYCCVLLSSRGEDDEEQHKHHCNDKERESLGIIELGHHEEERN